MFPDRFWLALGSGQLLNEHVTGARWPTKAERNRRLQESAQVMRRLWAGETVTHRSDVLTVSEATLWTRPRPPARPPMLVGAAVTPKTAAWVATWADALITVNQSDEQLDAIVAAFRDNGGAGKPMYLQVHVAYAPTEAEARAAAFDQWRQNTLDNSVMTSLAHPAQISAAARLVKPSDLDDAVRISADPARHAAWLRRDLERGFAGLFLHEVGPEQERFVESFGKDVLPALR
jgi:G6PDH family F420-dependent oxidoreductase